MYRFFSIALAASSLVVALPASAGNLNKRLKGDYAVSVMRICSSTQAGFGPAPQFQALGPVNNQTIVAKGVQSFDGDGNFTASLRAFVTNSSGTAAGGFPVSEVELTCSGTYQVNADHSFTTVRSCTGVALSGVIAGQTLTQSPIAGNGHIRGKMLQFADATPSVETTTLSLFGTSFRICGRSGTAVKIPKSKDE